MPIRKVIVSRNDAIQEHGPDLVRLPTGQLICLYRESDGHTVRRFSNLVYRTSLDGGHTWSDRQVLVEARPDAHGVVLKWNCPRIQRLGDGRLLALCDVMPCPPDERTDLRNSHIVLWWSDDEGVTWSPPQHTPVFGIMPDRVVELPSGAWLLVTQVYKQGEAYADHYARIDAGPKLTVVAHRSEDQGETWQGPYIVGQDDHYNLCEASTLLLPDGELVCYMRENSRQGWPAFKTFSSDEGRTWEGVYRTPMDGCHRPVAGLLPSGRVLVTYRYQQGGLAQNEGAWLGMEPSSWRTEEDGRVSFFGRNTFAYLETVSSAKARDLNDQGGIILPLDHDRSPRSDGGYTAWAVLHNSDIFCVNYIVDDAARAHIRGYWFREEDF
jgi:sialidase-1